MATTNHWQQDVASASNAVLRTILTLGVPAACTWSLRTYRNWKANRGERNAFREDLKTRVAGVETGLNALRDEVQDFKVISADRHAELCAQQNKIYSLLLKKEN